MERSQEEITESDLRRLLELSRKDISDFFERNSRYKKSYENREALIALCQGAALHYVDKKMALKTSMYGFFIPNSTSLFRTEEGGLLILGCPSLGKEKI